MGWGKSHEQNQSRQDPHTQPAGSRKSRASSHSGVSSRPWALCLWGLQGWHPSLQAPPCPSPLLSSPAALCPAQASPAGEPLSHVARVTWCHHPRALFATRAAQPHSSQGCASVSLPCLASPWHSLHPTGGKGTQERCCISGDLAPKGFPAPGWTVGNLTQRDGLCWLGPGQWLQPWHNQSPAPLRSIALSPVPSPPTEGEPSALLHQNQGLPARRGSPFPA